MRSRKVIENKIKELEEKNKLLIEKGVKFEDRLMLIAQIDALKWCIGEMEEDEAF
jgi:hypothetical protein